MSDEDKKLLEQFRNLPDLVQVRLIKFSVLCVSFALAKALNKFKEC